MKSNFLQNGYIAMQSQNTLEASEWFAKAVAQTPDHAQAVACWGQSLCWLGRRNEGLALLRRSGSLLLKQARKKREISQTLLMVDQLQYWGDFQGALDLARQAIEIDRSAVRGYQLLAISYNRLNQNSMALAAGRKAADLAPQSTMLKILLATLEIANKQYESAQVRLEKVLLENLSTEERFRAHKELAGALDRLEKFDQVFMHLNLAAGLSASLPEVRKQDPNLVPEMLETNIHGFDGELLSRWSRADFPEEFAPPIFVMGFMRSGTTLTQEVLGAHPDVFVADETDLIMATRAELVRLVGPNGTTPELLRKLDWEGVLHLRRFYWESARARFGDEIEQRRFLDKTTMNTIDLGFIHSIFPDAKLIFVTRDPRDVCLSCYMQTMIPTPSTVHLFTWEGTARFYAQIMNWWFEVRPRTSMDYLELRYEDIIADFEKSFRQVFERLDLSWDPAVAQFHQKAARKYIASPSFGQVSQPLYSSSVARWRRYEAEFEPVMSILEPFATAFGYSP